MFVNKKRKNRQIFDLNQLNARFRKISNFTNLKKFIRFFNVQQWIDVKQKIIVKQFLFVITFLFVRKWFHALNFFRAMIDFILFAQYRFHDENIFLYFDNALKRINFYKQIFRHLRSFDNESTKNHFNFFKFHVMFHYCDFIRKYDTTNKFDTFHDEIKHKYMLKTFFDKINKRNDFQSQLLRHNRRRINILIMKNVLRFEKIQHSNANNEIHQNFETRTIRDSIKLSFLKSMSIRQQKDRYFFRNLNSRKWCRVNDFVRRLKQSQLIFALAVFIKKQRQAIIDLMNNQHEQWRFESNFSWINDWCANLHDSLTCWIRNDHDSLNMKKKIEKKIRCKFNWQNKNNWKRNFVWMREKKNIRKNFDNNAFHDKLIEQFQIIVIVVDFEKKNNDSISIRYSNVLLKMMWFYNNVFNEIFEMIEIQSWFDKNVENQRIFEITRMYNMFAIMRSVHVIFNEKNDYYVNNYVNWNSYNTTYDADFLKIDVKKTKNFENNFFWCF